jgi:hypothetical protein
MLRKKGRTVMRVTHTYVVLEISPAAFAEIESKLKAAGYEHTFHEDREHGSLIDMHGIALAMDVDG